MSEIYDLNNTIFKDVIGSLNWKKFAERIKTQLKENQNLTQNQRNSMQFNAIISLIKSNSFDEAIAMLKKTKGQPEFKNEKDQAIFRTLQVYFLLKDKKYKEALELVPITDKVDP